ncbi:MAG: hypothetical protein RRB22_06705 [Gammaproteobacteria bacterium]|nr:hypothetical protein [Gammaproteobacteria bacterium]
MKLSKLDPMTVLMVVVALGVVVTMLSQNSIAAVDRVSVTANTIEKQAAAAPAQNRGQQTLHKGARSAAYGSPANIQARYFSQ